jgi:hypothetical protein
MEGKAERLTQYIVDLAVSETPKKNEKGKRKAKT